MSQKDLKKFEMLAFRAHGAHTECQYKFVTNRSHQSNVANIITPADLYQPIPNLHETNCMYNGVKAVRRGFQLVF